MKLISKIVGVTLGLAMAVGVGVGVAANRKAAPVFADDVEYKSMSFVAGNTSNSLNSYTASATYTSGGFSIATQNFNNNQKKWSNIRCGRKNTASVATLTTSAVIDVAVSKVTITIDSISAADVNSIKLYSKTSSAVSWTEESTEFTQAAGNQSVSLSDPAENLLYKVEFDCASTNTSTNGFVQISAIKFYRSTGGPSLSVSPTTALIAKGGTTTLSATATGGEGSVSWVTSDDDVVSISGDTGASITVRGEGRGTATVTASYSTASDVEIAIQVTDIQNEGTEASPFTVEEARDQIDTGTGLNGVYVTGIVSGIVEAYNSQYGNISYNISKDGSALSEQLQAYRGKSYGGVNFTSTNDIQVGATVVVYGNLLKYNSTYELAQNNELVSYSMPGVLDTPRPHYSEGQITWEAIDNAVSYDISIDGGEAIHNAVSPYNLGVLSSPAGHTVTVTAIASGLYSDSNPGTVKFALLTKAGTSVEPYDIPNARAAIDGETGVTGVYVAGIISQIDSFADNAITYWISDDGTTTNQFEVYKGKGISGADFNSEDDIEVGASVVVTGNIKYFNDEYEFNTGSQLYSYSAPVHPVDYYLDRATSFKTLVAHENCTIGNEGSVSKTITELTTANGWTVSAGSSIGTLVTSFDLDAVISISTTGNPNCGSIWGTTTNDWRLYQNQNGNVVVTAAEGYKLSSVTFTFSVDKTGALFFGEDQVASDSAVSLSGRSETFTVGNSGSATNGQVRITAIEVSYQEYTFNSVDSVALKLGAEFEKDDWDALAANYTIRDYGVMLFKRLADSQEPTLSVEDAFLDGKTLASVRKGSGEAPYLDTENHKYIFNAKVSISSSNYRLVIVAAPFIVIDDGTEDGDYHFLDQLECSAKSLADDYLDHGGSNLSSDALHVIAA